MGLYTMISKFYWLLLVKLMYRQFPRHIFPLQELSSLAYQGFLIFLRIVAWVCVTAELCIYYKLFHKLVCISNLLYQPGVTQLRQLAISLIWRVSLLLHISFYRENLFLDQINHHHVHVLVIPGTLTMTNSWWRASRIWTE